MKDEAPRDVLRVMAVSSDKSALDTIEKVARGYGDEFFATTDVAEAIALATKTNPQVAFIDLTTDGGAGLALVHHLPALAMEIALHVTAPKDQIELATQAVALGAAGMFVAPISGDDVAHAMSAVRERRAGAKRILDLEAELARSRRRGELLDRIVTLARGRGDSEAVRAIAEALADVCAATGIALYAAFDGDAGECVRLAATGTLRSLAAVTRTAEVRAALAALGARELPLSGSHGPIGFVAATGVTGARERELVAMADVASAVLALVDRRERDPAVLEDGKSRVYTPTYFADVAAREIEKAKRHDRRLSIAAIVLTDPSPASQRPSTVTPSSREPRSIERPDVSPRRARTEISEVVLTVVRDTDVLATSAERELSLLLPETGALGANICRRRLLSRMEGDRRAKSSANDRRGPISSRSGRAPLTIGVSTYPHDGADVERLMRVARRRAHEQARSSVHALELATMSLAEIVDTLLGRPIVDAGLSSLYPLELATNALVALASNACAEGRRGGSATVTVTTRSGMGVLAAARHVTADVPDVSLRVVDVRAIPSCGDIEAIVVAAEHGTWTCCGRVTRERFRGVHAADPLLADLITQRLAQAGGLRVG